MYKTMVVLKNYFPNNNGSNHSLHGDFSDRLNVDFTFLADWKMLLLYHESILHLPVITFYV